MNRMMILGLLLTTGLTSAQTVLPKALTSPPVTGMVWELQRVLDNGQTRTLISSPDNPSITLDGRAATGNAACNTFRAQYASRADILRFGPIITTRRGCATPKLSQEAQFLRLLKGTTRYTVASTVLTLYSGSGDLLIFRQRSGGKPAQPVPVQPEPAQPGASVPVLNGTSWRLQTLNGQKPSTAVPVSFKIGGTQLGGSDGCNSFGGEGSAVGGMIRATGNITATLRACTSDDQVPSLPALLQRGAAYRLSGNTLTLTGDGNTWVFTALVTTQTTPPVTTPPVTNMPLPSAVTLFDRASAADLGPDEDLYIVGPQQQDCVGVAAQRCLIVKQPGETAWKLFYGQIEGFTFRPGVTSLLRVRVERVVTPQADGSNVRYRLVRVLGTQTAR